MKYRRILAMALLSIFLALALTLGWMALSRISILTSYAKQNGIEINQEGTSLNLTMYGYPEQVRPVFDLFEYFTTENLEWRGTLPQSPGAPPESTGDIGLKLSLIEFWKADEDNYKGQAQNVEFQIKAVNVIDAFIAADSVGINITFWTAGELPALNMTALLTGNVVVRLSTTVLPLPGFQFVAYQYSGERYLIHICAIKPIDVTINMPGEGEVRDNIPISATVKTAPGISVKGVWWYARGERYYEGGMNYDGKTGVAEAVWETWHGPDGGYQIGVKAVGYQVNVQGPDYTAEAWRNVYVKNAAVHVTSWVWSDSDQRYNHVGGLMVGGWLPEKQVELQTPFDLDRRRGTKLEAPPEWNLGDGNTVHFERWVISDGNPNNGWIWEGGDRTIGFDDWILEMLYGPPPRELQGLYRP